MTATTNLESAHVPNGSVLIKNYSENQGILEVMEEAGIVKRTFELPQLAGAFICQLLIPIS